MAKKISKKASKTSKKKAKSNIFSKIIIAVFVLILIVFFAFRYIPKLNSNSKQTTEKQLVKGNIEKNKNSGNQSENTAANPSIAKIIEGCWMSTTGGAVLTMKGKEYRIDFMGVDIGEPITGTYTIENETIIFTNAKEPLKGEKGVYDVKFENNEISFKCKNDNLTKRKATLVTEWEWLEE